MNLITLGSEVLKWSAEAHTVRGHVPTLGWAWGYSRVRVRVGLAPREEWVSTWSAPTLNSAPGLAGLGNVHRYRQLHTQQGLGPRLRLHDRPRDWAQVSCQGSPLPQFETARNEVWGLEVMPNLFLVLMRFSEEVKQVAFVTGPSTRSQCLRNSPAKSTA